MPDPTAGKTAEQLIRETAPKPIARIVITATSNGMVFIQGEPSDSHILEWVIIGGLKALWLQEQGKPGAPRIIPP